MKDEENFNYRATGWAKQVGAEKNMKPGERFVFITLAGFYNNDRRSAFPSVELLAKETGMGSTTIQRHLNSLEGMGVIRREKEKGEGKKYTHNVYRFPGYVPEVRAAGRPKTTKPGTFDNGTPYVSPPGQVQEAGFFT